MPKMQIKEGVKAVSPRQISRVQLCKNLSLICQPVQDKRRPCRAVSEDDQIVWRANRPEEQPEGFFKVRKTDKSHGLGQIRFC